MPLTLIDSAHHIVLVAHEHPDADSLGSACAFYSHVLRYQKKVTLYCSTTVGDHNLLFLPWSDKIRHNFPDDADLVISFDCGHFKRLGIEYSGELINFDHHISNEQYGTYNCIDATALSTTQILYGWFVANGIKINGKMANALYAGLLDDTDCFSDPLCTSVVFEMAQALIGLGADHEQCVKWLFNSHSLASMRLRGVMLSKMKIVHDGEVALFEVDRSMLDSTGALLRDCKTTLDEALSIKTVRVALLVVELKQGGVKISLRSDGSVNTAHILEEYGGGGHYSRSGARIAGIEMVEAVKKLLISITRELDETQS
ncbi:MAG: DHH family phosphoesterase [Sulfuricurvum sp.]|uniref:DHH family phosphoesterase n=1 Tax=Sulfuricurvum sp. TaxID=2025608 RepID=UPI0026038AC8|nr:DHH family phosphoesterase [Sulfuricurvum sp.]MDD2829977.1 DHH family phosphoesterase [Sulfuricurvum sp.]MDD4949082.1 DHH family phosphoesterase [Sulfuricurvum sp.]